MCLAGVAPSSRQFRQGQGRQLPLGRRQAAARRRLRLRRRLPPRQSLGRPALQRRHRSWQRSSPRHPYVARAWLYVICSGSAGSPSSAERPSRSRPSSRPTSGLCAAGRPMREEHADAPGRGPACGVCAPGPAHLVVLTCHQRHIRRQGPGGGPPPAHHVRVHQAGPAKPGAEPAGKSGPRSCPVKTWTAARANCSASSAQKVAVW